MIIEPLFWGRRRSIWVFNGKWEMVKIFDVGAFKSSLVTSISMLFGIWVLTFHCRLFSLFVVGNEEAEMLNKELS